MEIPSNSPIEILLNKKPYSLTYLDKNQLFLNAMKESVKFHFFKSKEFSNLCKSKNFDPDSDYLLESLPFLPVSIFKKFKLKSVLESEIFKTIHSSATTGNNPSTIFLDRITSQRQTKALVSIMSNFLLEKKDFIVFDTKESKQDSSEVKSRSSAIRGFLPFMQTINFVLDEQLSLNVEKIQSFKHGNSYCIFGFTWLLYKIINENNNEEIKNYLRSFNHPNILHIGGWKKLQDLKITKEDFYDQISDFFDTPKEKIIDIYGMTEQLGTIYPDCEYGNKHVPVYSEIIIRNPNTLREEEIKKTGLIQLISPIPHSYPGVSLLSDDLGHIVGIDDCPCGRKGKYFVFDKRSDKVEVKGCGDSIN
jgi:hypothetical protein